MRAKLKVFVFSRRDLDREEVARRFASDWAHDPTPYGFDAAELLVEKTEYSRSKQATALSERLFNKLGFDAPHAFYNLKGMRQADVIWTVLEWEWLGASFLQRIRVLQRKPIVGNSVWFPDQWGRWGHLRKAMYRLFSGEDLILTLHSRRALQSARAALPGREFQILPFGISTRAFPITKPAIRDPASGAIRVYSIGTDATRDWPTMLDAFGNDSRFEVRLVSGALSPDQERQYSNVTIRSRAKASEQREHYKWADFVIMPMVDNCFSGISVALEAAAMGKPLVCSATGGVDTYFNEREVRYVQPEEASALRAAVLRIDANEALELATAAQARFIHEDYSASGMVQRYIKLSTTAIAARRRRPGSVKVTATSRIELPRADVAKMHELRERREAISEGRNVHHRFACWRNAVNNLVYAEAPPLGFGSNVKWMDLIYCVLLGRQMSTEPPWQS